MIDSFKAAAGQDVEELGQMLAQNEMDRGLEDGLREVCFKDTGLNEKLEEKQQLMDEIRTLIS